MRTRDHSSPFRALAIALLGGAGAVVAWGAAGGDELGSPEGLSASGNRQHVVAIVPVHGASSASSAPIAIEEAATVPAAVARARVASGKARVRPEDAVLDFGTVLAGQPLRRTFVLHNDGEQPLKVYGTRSSSGAMTVRCDTEIPGGGEGEIEVAILGSAVKPGRFSHHIEIGTSDPTCWMLMVEGEVGSR